MKRFLGIAALCAFLATAHAQWQLNPRNQVNWSQLSGTAAPTNTVPGFCGNTATGTTTSGANTVSVSNGVAASGAIVANQTVTGTGIPAGTTVTAVNQPNGTITLSQNATASGSVNLTFYALGMPYVDTSNHLSYACGGSGWFQTSGAAALGYTPLNPANNLSDVTDAATARTNLGVLAGSYGTGAPTTSCSSANYGASYTDVSGGTTYTCGSAGWWSTSSAGSIAKNAIAWLGDSYTADSCPGSGSPFVCNAYYSSGFAYQAMATSKQQLYMVGAQNYAIGGYTCAQVQSAELPLVLAASPKPGFVSLLCGTDDIYTATTPAQTGATIQQIAQSLISAGIKPILNLIAPNNAHAAKAQQVNQQIRQVAQALHLPLVDNYTAFADSSGDIQSTYNGDGEHLNQAGQDLMGKNWYTQTSSLLATIHPWLPTTTTDGINIISNPLMQTCTSGVPSGWNNQSFGGGMVAPSATCTSDASLPNTTQWWNLTFTITGTSGDYWTMYQAAAATTPTAGDTVLAVWHYKVSGLETLASSGATVRFMVHAFDGSASWVFPVNLNGDCTDCIAAIEFTWPTADNAMGGIYVSSGTSSGTVNLSLTQVGLVDLTTNGFSSLWPWSN